jgi:hypothetical protein
MSAEAYGKTRAGLREYEGTEVTGRLLGNDQFLECQQSSAA